MQLSSISLNIRKSIYAVNTRVRHYVLLQANDDLHFASLFYQQNVLQLWLKCVFGTCTYMDMFTPTPQAPFDDQS